MNERAAPGYLKGCLVALALVVATPVIAWKFFAYFVEMNRIPDGLSINGKIHGEEQTFGFGPGGAETGLAIYVLSSDDAERLKAQNATLIDSDRIGAAMGQSGKFGAWRRTPIDVDGDPRSWGESGQVETPRAAPRIRNFLGRYGFAIPVEPPVEALVDSVISTDGAYYAYGQGGSLIVVAPKQELIIFAFAG